LDKYIEAGGIDKLYELYKAGNYEYSKYEMNRTFTVDERAYIENLAAKGGKVLIALEHFNYPFCFYNEMTKNFQGIAPDVLAEISGLTGIVFENVTAKDASWAEIFEKLKDGGISLISDLRYSEDRKNDFLWPEKPYARSRYALLSKSDCPNLEMYQVVRNVVGIVRETIYDEMYHKWFPNNNNVKYYDILDEAIAALEKGEIDLLMESEYGLLYQTNLREKHEYKVNILFNSPISESFFGLYKNEKDLCSIISKAQNFVNTAKIEKDWTNRVFDYSRKIFNERYILLFVAAIIFFLMIIFLVILLLRNSRMGALYKDKMITLSTIYDAIPDLVYCMDTNCAFTSCNHSYEKFIGRKESEILGKTDLELYEKTIDNAQGFMEINKKVINERTQITVEETTVRADDVPRIMEAIKTPLIRNGKITGLLGISRDITEHKDAELAAQEASRAKSSFLAKMSHEIRTPMNAIMGMTELALRADELDDARTHIFTVKQASANLLSIINDILDFSKIETGKLEIISGDYLFSSLINDVINIIRMRVIDSQIRFVVNIDSTIPNSLIGDEVRIRQVMLNILGNAVKYTDKGFVSLSISGIHISDDTITLVIEVEDSGKGIKTEDLSNLFGEYVQFDAEKNKGIEGTGLGLAIAKNIIKTMGGDIGVRSEYGKGSTFTVTLPQKIYSDHPLAAVLKREEKSVLVYERREIYAKSIVYTVENLGVYCDLVSNVSELLEKVAERDYSLIFIAFSLYKKNRDELVKLCTDKGVVLLTEFGETVTDKNLNILSMPVHTLAVADILNGEKDNFSYSEKNESVVGFTAPDAVILVVDDIVTNLKVAQGLLTPYNMRVDLCKSGISAIEAIKTNHYDLVFMDHRMPEMDGMEATQLIRGMAEENEYFGTVPIVALTANAVTGTKEMFLQNGFNDFLSKPIDTIKLNTTLEKWIPKEKQKSFAVENG
jgi:PAS domain S-box-containing protein